MDSGSHAQVASCGSHKYGCRQLSFSSNGKLLASATGTGELVIWDTATWKEQSRFGPANKDDSPITSLLFVNDDKELLVGYTEGVAGFTSFVVWSIERKCPLRLLSFLNGWGTSAVSRDGAVLAISSRPADSDRASRVASITTWDTGLWTRRLTMEHGSGCFHALDFSHDGKQLIAAGKLEKPGKQNEFEPVLVVFNHLNGDVIAKYNLEVGNVCVLADKKTLALSRDGKIYLYDFAKLLAGEYPDAQPVKE